MSATSMVITPEQQLALERFYFYEARLLDERCFQQWLALVSPDITYSVPSRVNVQVDNRERGQESMIGIRRELEDTDSLGCPVREETYVHLMVRVERAYKINSWSEQPPPRTRRIVGNIELMSSEGGELSVLSNFHMHYARPGSENAFYSGQRRDTLLAKDDGYMIGSREVILDYSDIQLPTLGLLF